MQPGSLLPGADLELWVASRSRRERGPRMPAAEELAVNRPHSSLEILVVHGERVGDHRSARRDQLDVNPSLGHGLENPGGDAMRISEPFPDETDEGRVGRRFDALDEAGR